MHVLFGIHILSYGEAIEKVAYKFKPTRWKHFIQLPKTVEI